jgi:hypothetical protein
MHYRNPSPGGQNCAGDDDENYEEEIVIDNDFHDLLCPCGCCGGHCRGRACRPAGGAGNAGHCRRSPPLRASERHKAEQASIKKKKKKKRRKQAKRNEERVDLNSCFAQKGHRRASV